MIFPESAHGRAEAFNARAKAEGHFLNKDYRELPRDNESILDVPETEKMKSDLDWFRAERKKRKRGQSGIPIEEVQHETEDLIRHRLENMSVPDAANI